MDRIDRIKALLAEVDQPEAEASAKRWIASRLIWEEVSEGTSRRELAEKIGKSHTHVRYMFNCWEMVGRKLGVSGEAEGLPPFQEIYMSAEVRGAPEEERRMPPPQPEQQPERDWSVGAEPATAPYTAAGFIATAEQAIQALADNTAFWPLFTAEDKAGLARIRHAIDQLLTP
jgi:hypothetical protein